MDIMPVVYIVGALLAGVLIPVQTGYNTQLAKAMHGPTMFWRFMSSASSS